MLQPHIDALIQRAAGHVLECAARGALPALAWHTGLSAGERQTLQARWSCAAAWNEAAEPQTLLRTASVDDQGLLAPLRALLLAHRGSTEPALTVLANVVASASFGSHHLWQDLGLVGRQQVSALLEFGFPTLYFANHRNLKWKRHLFVVLGQELGRDGLRPPKCNDCDEYAGCFGDSTPTAEKTWLLKLAS